ncbi:hypothetical protein ACFP3Q_08710 [Nocardioides sp. GCM10027113]|uniref:hypothetical protein n=1 Tax=unclassified Nocardioides TaxID=2615069 RepID=UPI003608FC90
MLRARDLGVVVALGLVGGIAGYAWDATRPGPDLADATPLPVAAADPAVPWTPPEKEVNPDADLPPVGTDLEMSTARMGTPRTGGIELPVPADWPRTDLGDGLGTRWSAPGNPDGGYSVRVQVVDRNRSLAQAVAERAAALPLDPRVSDLEVLQQSGDTLIASYILSGYRKLQIIRWVGFDGTNADVEIAAEGRLIDQPGLEALVARMATDIRRQRPRPAPPASG